MMRSDCVLTTAIGYEPTDAELFLRSLKAFSNARVFVFADDSLSKLPSSCAQVTILHEKSHPELFRSGIELNTPNNERYFWYRNLLLQQGNAFNRILLADLRDVVFQADPFELVSGSGLQVAAEPVRLGNCGSNSAWFSAVYGASELRRYADNPVFCSGTTLGPFEAQDRYLAFMCSELGKHGPGLDGGRQTLIIDQAIHNFFCYSHDDSISVHNNETGGIATLHHGATACFGRDGRLLNTEGHPFHIIHQYDRFRVVKTIIKERWNFRTRYDVEISVREFLANWSRAKLWFLFRAVWFGVTRKLVSRDGD